MSQEGGSLTCTVTQEWLNAQGAVTRKVSHRTGTLQLIRDSFRNLYLEVRGDKSASGVRHPLKGMTVFNRYMTEGKASIKFNDEKCTLLISNAPSASLVSFLKLIFVKVTNQTSKLKNPLTERILGGVTSTVEEVSPATNAELKVAKEKAMKGSRTTITTPSPSNVRKRKMTDDRANIPVAKTLYPNPTAGEMTQEQKVVLDTVLRGKSLFYTGSAGTGKSFLLKKIIAALPPDVTMATASTGVAACHIGGITLHQFAGIGTGTATLERCYQLASRPNVVSAWRRTKYLIIDEISMVDSEFFDKLEAVARHVRRNDKPFGGIQLILCGDFFQLPPVAKREEKVKFCFQSKAWSQCVTYNFELRKVHRQKDGNFVDILNSIRIGRVTAEITETLQATAMQRIEKDGILATRLCSHVREADDINETQLDKLPGHAKVFVAQDSEESMTSALDQQTPVPHKLTLKVGAQVMLLKNVNISSGLVNGARGVVVSFSSTGPVVRFRSGEEYTAQSEKWSVKQSSGAIVTRKQIPLKLAWAFSIHKSQGLTLDCVEMSLSRVFNAGQAYVALSRAQSLETLRVLDFTSQVVWADTSVLEFYKRFRRTIQDVEMIPLGKKRKLEKKY